MDVYIAYFNVLFKHISVCLTNFMGIPNSVRMLYSTLFLIEL